MAWLLFVYCVLSGPGNVLALRWCWQARCRRRAAMRERTAAGRMERIARLEIACGVGLAYARDVVTAAPIRAMQSYMQDMAERGNGQVERACWSCDQSFKPGNDHDRYYGGHDELHDRLCKQCLAGAQAELSAL